MRLILTYHVIQEHAGPGEANFYTVSPDRFEAQLVALKSRGGKSIRLDELLRKPHPGDADFILTFDDNTVDHYENVFPLLQKHGCFGTFFVSTEKLNQPGRLTEKHIREMSAAGHCFGSHSHEHKRMDVLSRDEIRDNLEKSRDILAGLTGAAPLTFAPPGGFINQNVRDGVRRAGMKALRTMRWGYNLNLDFMNLETVPINQYVEDEKFVKLLEARGPSMVYAGKESLKRVLPLAAYEWLRRQVFKARSL